MTIADELDHAMLNFRHQGGRKGISQPELAALSGVPQPTISRTLKGLSTPETKTLMKLAKALGCTLGGYTGGNQASPSYAANSKVRALKVAEPEALPEPLAEILRAAKTMSREGQHVLLGQIQVLAKQYPKAKANRSS